MAKSTRFSLEVGGWDETVSYVEAGTVGTGSFSPITVEDAINDLPGELPRTYGDPGWTDLPAFEFLQ
jgi:hypothetical protein